MDEIKIGLSIYPPYTVVWLNGERLHGISFICSGIAHMCSDCYEKVSEYERVRYKAR